MSNSYRARLYKQNSGHPLQSELSLESGMLSFTTEEGQYSISLTEFVLDLSGHAEDRIKLTDTSSGLTFLCEDRHLISALAGQGDYPVCQQARKALSKLKNSWVGNKLYWCKIVFVTVAVLLGSYFAIDMIATAAFMNLSPDMESKVGEFITSTKIKKPETVKSGASYDRVNKIGNTLVGHIKDNPYKFSFYVDSDKTLNACAYPGGTVFVNQGLLDLASDDELAGIMGHELGHVSKRHTLKTFAHSIGLWTTLRLLLLSVGEQNADKIAEAMNLGERLEALQFSRTQESEADKIGTELAVDSDYRGDALITFFERLQKESSVSDNKFLALLSDHPMNQDRIDTIKAILTKLKAAGKNIAGHHTAPVQAAKVISEKPKHKSGYHPKHKTK